MVDDEAGLVLELDGADGVEVTGLLPPPQVMTAGPGGVYAFPPLVGLPLAS